MVLGPNSKSWPNGARFQEILVLADLHFANNLNLQKPSKTMSFFKITQKCALVKCLDFWRYWFKKLVWCSLNTFLEEIFFILSLTDSRLGTGPKLEKLTKRCSILWNHSFSWFWLCRKSKSSKIVKTMWLFKITQKCALAKCLQFWRNWFENLV